MHSDFSLMQSFELKSKFLQEKVMTGQISIKPTGKVRVFLAGRYEVSGFAWQVALYVAFIAGPGKNTVGWLN